MDEQIRIDSAGAVLSYYRRKYELTLEQVCDGICSPSTLFRLEDGYECADSLTSSLLLERIGKQAYQFELVLNDADYELWFMRESIIKHMHNKEYEQVQKELAGYRRMKKIIPGIHEQFCLCQEVSMLEAALRDSENSRQEECAVQTQICETAMRALHLTKPAFTVESQCKNALYTTAEMELILTLVQYGAYQKTAVYVESILSDMFHYIEYYDTNRRKQGLGSRILINLVNLAQTLQDQDKVLSYIDKGIDYVAQGREIANLDRLRFLRAQALMTRYKNEAYKDSAKRRAIQEECLMAYSICSVFGDCQQMQTIERFCEEELKWQITKLEM